MREINGNIITGLMRNQPADWEWFKDDFTKNNGQYTNKFVIDSTLAKRFFVDSRNPTDAELEIYFQHMAQDFIHMVVARNPWLNQVDYKDLPEITKKYTQTMFWKWFSIGANAKFLQNQNGASFDIGSQVSQNTKADYISAQDRANQERLNELYELALWSSYTIENGTLYLENTEVTDVQGYNEFRNIIRSYLTKADFLADAKNINIRSLIYVQQWDKYRPDGSFFIFEPNFNDRTQYSTMEVMNPYEYLEKMYLGTLVVPKGEPLPTPEQLLTAYTGNGIKVVGINGQDLYLTQPENVDLLTDQGFNATAMIAGQDFIMQLDNGEWSRVTFTGQRFLIGNPNKITIDNTPAIGFATMQKAFEAYGATGFPQDTIIYISETDKVNVGTWFAAKHTAFTDLGVGIHKIAATAGGGATGGGITKYADLNAYKTVVAREPDEDLWGWVINPAGITIDGDTTGKWFNPKSRVLMAYNGTTKTYTPYLDSDSMILKLKTYDYTDVTTQKDLWEKVIQDHLVKGNHMLITDPVKGKVEVVITAINPVYNTDSNVANQPEYTEIRYALLGVHDVTTGIINPVHVEKTQLEVSVAKKDEAQPLVPLSLAFIRVGKASSTHEAVDPEDLVRFKEFKVADDRSKANEILAKDNKRRLDENDKTTFSITPNSYIGGLTEMLEHFNVPVPQFDLDGAAQPYGNWKDALTPNMVLDTIFDMTTHTWITEQQAKAMGFSDIDAAKIAKSAQWAKTYIYTAASTLPVSVGGVKVDMSFRPYVSPIVAGTQPTVSTEHDQLLFKAPSGSEIDQLLLEFMSSLLYQESDKIAEVQANMDAVDVAAGETPKDGFQVINVIKAAGTAANVKFGDGDPVNQQSGAGFSKTEIFNKNYISNWATFGDSQKTANEILTTPQVVRPAPVDKNGNTLPNPAVDLDAGSDKFRGSFLTVQNASDGASLSGDNQLIYKSTEVFGLPNTFFWKLMNKKQEAGAETYNLLTDANDAAALASTNNEWAETNGTTGARDALFCDDDFYYPPRGSGTGDGSRPNLNPQMLQDIKINNRYNDIWVGHIPLLKSLNVKFRMATIPAANLTNPHIRVNFVLALAYRSAADKNISNAEIERQMNLITDYYFAPTTDKLNALKALDYVESEFANLALKDTIINTASLSGVPTQITETWNTASYTLPKGIHVFATKNANGDVTLYWAMPNAYDPHGEDGVVAIPVELRIEVSTSGASATLGAGVKTLEGQISTLSTDVKALDAKKEDKLQRWDTVAEMDADIAPTHANDLGWNNETNKLYRYDAVNNKWVTFDAQSILGTDNTGNDVELEIDNTDPKNPKISGGLSSEYLTSLENTHIKIGNEIIKVDNKAIGLLQDVNALQDRSGELEGKRVSNPNGDLNAPRVLDDLPPKTQALADDDEKRESTLATLSDVHKNELEIAKNKKASEDLEKGKQDLHDYSTLATQKEVYDRIIADGLIPETEVILSVGGVKTHAHIVQLDTAAKEFTFMITGDWKAADGTHVTSFKKGLVDGTATTGLPTGGAGIIQAEQFKAKSEATEDKHLIRLKEYKVDKAADKVWKDAKDAKDKSRDDIVSGIIVETNKVAVEVLKNTNGLATAKADIVNNATNIAGVTIAAAAGLKWHNPKPATLKSGDIYPEPTVLTLPDGSTVTLNKLVIYSESTLGDASTGSYAVIIDPASMVQAVEASGKFVLKVDNDATVKRLDDLIAANKQEVEDFKVALQFVTLPQYEKKTELAATLAARDVANAAALALKLNKDIYDAFIIKYGTDKAAEDKALADYKTANNKALLDGLKGKVSNTVGGAAIDPLKTYLAKGGELVEYVPPKAFSTFATKVLLDAEIGMKAGDLAYVSETHSWYDYDGAAWKNAYTDAQIDAAIKVVADRVKVLEDIRIDDTDIESYKLIQGAW